MTFRPILSYLDPASVSRFRAKVHQQGPNDCWPWTGQRNNRGYGRFEVWPNSKRVRLLAHRVAFALAASTDIDTSVLMHACDNPPCCNPAHLRQGTQLDNMRDAREKGRVNMRGLEIGQHLRRRGIGRKSRATHCARGHEFTEANTITTGTGRNCRTCKRIAGRDAYRRSCEASIRSDVVRAAVQGESVELTLWERRMAIDTMIRRGDRVCVIARTLNVPRRTINGRRARLRSELAALPQSEGTF